MRISVVTRTRAPHGPMAARTARGLAAAGHEVSLWAVDRPLARLSAGVPVVAVHRRPWRLAALAEQDAVIYWLGSADTGQDDFGEILSARPGFVVLERDAVPPPAATGLLLADPAAVPDAFAFAGPCTTLPGDDDERIAAVASFLARHAPCASLLVLADRVGRALRDSGAEHVPATTRSVAAVLADITSA